MSAQNTKNDAPRADEHSKDKALEPYREDPKGAYLTTDQGLRVPSTDDSLKAGPRGPTLLEDFHLREKITHFDHERIPERAVHARGAGAHGTFQVYEPLAELTKAKFLNDPSLKTPVFVRFSTVAGSRGSADTARDVRGFATKFYTEEGNFDLVGNNIPVFFIQDGIKFPDLVHSVKPEPHNEIPQASSAHDSFWDFISLTPETMHMIMWILSDRAIPRSFRMMEGFGVHTFRLVNAAGKASFVKFHWKPLLGVHSLLWDEAQKLAGKDADFHRRDLFEAIEMGDFAEYELGLQIIPEEDEGRLSFDLLDATKLVPEELYPVRRVGKMTLNRNPDNFFAETEQIAYCPANLVPGIDLTDDPLLQARLFSYLDTQISRLGSPNFPEIPINRPIAPVHNHQQDGHMRQTINKGRANYHPNSRGGGCPMVASPQMGAFVHHPEKMEGHKIRERSETFKDHYSQATLFWNSMSDVEKKHLVNAARFELSKVEAEDIRQRMVEHFGRVNADLGRMVAERVGVPALAAPGAAAPKAAKGLVSVGDRAVDRSEALSMAGTVKDTIKSRRVAILAENGFGGPALTEVRAALTKAGAHTDVVSRALGSIKSAEGQEIKVDKSLMSTESAQYDAVFIAGGKGSVEAQKGQGKVAIFIADAFKYCKAIGAVGEGVDLLPMGDPEGAKPADAGAPAKVHADKGVVTSRGASGSGAFSEAFIKAIAEHRHWEREAEE